MKKVLLLIFAFVVIVISIFVAHKIISGGKNSWVLSSFNNDARIGVLEINGAIMQSRPILEKYIELIEDPSVKGVIIRINSPGGAVGASQELYSVIKKYKDKENKPVCVSIENIGASGGYYAALAADRIYADPGALTGSIGVIMEFYNSSELWDKIGVDFKTIKSGKYKDMGNPVRDMTTEEESILKASSDDVYDQFTQAVVREREPYLRAAMKKQKIEKMDDYVEFIANGKIFSGRQAKEYGLIDECGDIYDVAALMKGSLKLTGDIEFVYPKVKKKFPFMNAMVKSAVNEIKSQNTSASRLLYMSPLGK